MQDHAGPWLRSSESSGSLIQSPSPFTPPNNTSAETVCPGRFTSLLFSLPLQWRVAGSSVCWSHSADPKNTFCGHAVRERIV